MSKPVEVGAIKVGHNIIIEGEPCRIVEYEKSKPGKHGSAKARIVGIGLFDNVKRSIVSPVDAKIDVPLIEKRSGQVVSMSPDSIQLMDLETYDIFLTGIPVEEEIKSKLVSGAEVEYWKILDRIKVTRLKGG